VYKHIQRQLLNKNYENKITAKKFKEILMRIFRVDIGNLVLLG